MVFFVQQASGGGGGGRVILQASEKFEFSGSYAVRGGVGANEAGGSGTAIIVMPSEDGQGTIRKLFVDNNNETPLKSYPSSQDSDSGRTYILASEEIGVDAYWFDEVTIVRKGHLAFRSDIGSLVEVYIGQLKGDQSGILHVMRDMKVSVNQSQSPFPAAFGVYQDGIFHTPECKNRFCILIPVPCSVTLIGDASKYLQKLGRGVYDNESQLGVPKKQHKS